MVLSALLLDKIIQELSIHGETIYGRVKLISLLYVAQSVTNSLDLEMD